MLTVIFNLRWVKNDIFFFTAKAEKIFFDFSTLLLLKNYFQLVFQHAGTIFKCTRLVQDQNVAVVGSYGNKYSQNFGMCQRTRLTREQIVNVLGSCVNKMLTYQARGGRYSAKSSPKNKCRSRERRFPQAESTQNDVPRRLRQPQKDIPHKLSRHGMTFPLLLLPTGFIQLESIPIIRIYVLLCIRTGHIEEKQFPSKQYTYRAY